MLQLEPMPALERRWVHLALREIDGVTTQSIGEEPNRRDRGPAPQTRRLAPGTRHRPSTVAGEPPGRLGNAAPGATRVEARGRAPTGPLLRCGDACNETIR